MRDFSQKYRGVAHFGLWAEERADSLGHADAWKILCNAVRQCTTKDFRSCNDVKDALEWFEYRADRKRPHSDFKTGLNIVDPMQRYWALQDALKRIGQQAGINVS